MESPNNFGQRGRSFLHGSTRTQRTAVASWKRTLWTKSRPLYMKIAPPHAYPTLPMPSPPTFTPTAWLLTVCVYPQLKSYLLNKGVMRC